MKPLAPNTLLQNRYLIVQLIGKGGMGEVYLAVDQRLGSAVALKRTFFSDDETLGSAFEREARTLARLRHPILPKVSDHFTENETQYLVMEHITGDDLSKRLELTDKPFPLNWVLFWADQLLDALAYLHGHEPPIVHRDIKPQNLKLTDENHIVLLDFGLAKNSIGNTRVSTTTGGSVVGYTPHYAPMEQIRGTGTNPRSDIYSFSATFYQLMTNIVPADALTRADSVLNGIADPVVPLYELNAEIPKPISDAILKGMALSMDQRYASARDMQKALRESYAAMQSSMGAQTMAFTNSEAGSGEQTRMPTQSQQPTEQYSNSKNSPAEFDSFSSGKTEDNPADDSDKTLNDQSGFNGEKTEIIPFDKLPRAENYPSSTMQATPNAVNSSPAPHNDFNQQATVPPIDSHTRQSPETREAGGAANYNSQPKTEGNYAPTANAFSPSPTAPQAQSAAFSPAPAIYNQPKQKSGGKGLAIAGGIGALGIVAVGAAAIGWYALKPAEPTVAAPTPTPQVETVSTPTTAPTAEVSSDTVTDPLKKSTEVVSSSPENNGDQTVSSSTEKNNPQRTTTQTVKPTPTKAAPTPRVVTVKTPAPQKTPPPAKTPAKSSRTDILQ